MGNINIDEEENVFVKVDIRAAIQLFENVIEDLLVTAERKHIAITRDDIKKIMLSDFLGVPIGVPF